MSANAILSDRDVNAPLGDDVVKDASSKTAGPTKSLDYHRQMLQSKLSEDGGKQQYVSPSDNIMSPCTAKLSAYKSKHLKKAKPQSLFGKPSTGGSGATELFGVPKTEDKNGMADPGADESLKEAS